MCVRDQARRRADRMGGRQAPGEQHSIERVDSRLDERVTRPTVEAAVQQRMPRPDRFHRFRGWIRLQQPDEHIDPSVERLV